MIDLRQVQENPDIAKASQIARGADPGLIDVVLRADDERRKCLTAFEEKERTIKGVIPQYRQSASGQERCCFWRKLSLWLNMVKAAEDLVKTKTEETNSLLSSIANVILDGVPSGGEDDYVVLRHVGQVQDLNPRVFRFRII